MGIVQSLPHEGLNVAGETVTAELKSQIHINDGSLNYTGRDSHTHVHYHGVTTVSIESVLQAIPNFRKFHQDMLGKATPRTGAWLFKGRVFGVWLSPGGEIKVLWGSGIPGAGKTILASIVVGVLQTWSRESKNKIYVGFVYFRYSDHAEVTVRDILEILVKQAYERHPECRVLISFVYTPHIQEGTQPTEEDLLYLLKEVADSMVATFFVLDAIDEAPPGIRLHLLKTLVSSGARLFVTSRPLPHLEAMFPQAHVFPIVPDNDDLDLHITHKLETSETLHDLLSKAGSTVKQQLISAVKSQCGGMFLHATLQLEALQRCLTPHDVIRTLHQFSANVEYVYQQTWTRILNSEPHHVYLAQSALIWVLNAKQTMSIDQLRHALATSPQTLTFDPLRLIPEAFLVTICRGLITVDSGSRLVRLVHYTAKSPLERLLDRLFPCPHSYLASVCMGHMSSCGLQCANIPSVVQMRQILLEDPFLQYAYDAWVFHVTQSPGFSQARLVNFIGNCHAFPVDNYPGGRFDLIGPLHLAVFYNLPRVIPALSHINHSNSQTTKHGHTPLSLACLLGNIRAVEALLRDPHILINELDPYGSSALMVAASYGKEGAIKLLLTDPRTKVNLVGPLGQSALLHAASRGQVGALKTLLSCADTEVNHIDTHGRSALWLAASGGRISAVKLLLSRPEIEVNLRDNGGMSPLIVAASNDHRTITKLLVAHPRTDVNMVDGDGCSALLTAASNGEGAITKSLLARSEIDVNQLDVAGSSALMLAASYGYDIVVRLLLQHPDTRVNAANPDGTTPLLGASFYGHTKVVKLLLAAPEIEVNAVDTDGDTAIIVAAEQGHSKIVEMLLKVPGIDVELQGKDGHTAVSAAEANGHTVVVALLHEFAAARTTRT